MPVEVASDFKCVPNYRCDIPKKEKLKALIQNKFGNCYINIKNIVKSSLLDLLKEEKLGIYY